MVVSNLDTCSGDDHDANLLIFWKLLVDCKLTDVMSRTGILPTELVM
jgi:hypothetical protein